VSATMARFSATSVRSARSMCRRSDLATRVTTGAWESSNLRTCGSCSARAPALRVAPKATSAACRSSSSPAAARAKNSVSFGSAPGQPPSMKPTPSASRCRADRELVGHRVADALALGRRRAGSCRTRGSGRRAGCRRVRCVAGCAAVCAGPGGTSAVLLLVDRYWRRWQANKKTPRECERSARRAMVPLPDALHDNDHTLTCHASESSTLEQCPFTRPCGKPAARPCPTAPPAFSRSSANSDDLTQPCSRCAKSRTRCGNPATSAVVPTGVGRAVRWRRRWRVRPTRAAADRRWTGVPGHAWSRWPGRRHRGLHLAGRLVPADVVEQPVPRTARPRSGPRCPARRCPGRYTAPHRTCSVARLTGSRWPASPIPPVTRRPGR